MIPRKTRRPRVREDCLCLAKGLYDIRWMLEPIRRTLEAIREADTDTIEELANDIAREESFENRSLYLYGSAQHLGHERLIQDAHRFDTFAPWKSGLYVGQLSAVAYFYEACRMALISPSDIKPEVANFILP